MPQQVDEGGGALLRALIENTGVIMHLGNSVRAIGQLGDRLIGYPG